MTINCQRHHARPSKVAPALRWRNNTPLQLAGSSGLDYPNLVPENADKTLGNILYVEDDSASGRLVQSIVEREGYTIKVVSSGQEF